MAPARVPDRPPARGQADRRLRRPRQGEHAAQLLRHPHGPARVHGRPQSLQAGAVPARHAHPDPPSRRARAGPSRLHPDPALEPEGRDRGPAVHTRDAGARSSSSRSRRWRCCEGRHLLRRAGTPNARGLRGRAEADDPDRPAAGPLARHEVLRAFRLHRLRAVPGLQGRGHQALLPHLQRGDGERLRAVGWRRERPPPEDRHPQLEHHVRRHRPAQLDRGAAARRARAPRRRRDVPRELRRHAHRCAPSGDDRARQVDRGDGELPRGHARTTASTSSRYRTMGSCATSAT